MAADGNLRDNLKKIAELCYSAPRDIWARATLDPIGIILRLSAGKQALHIQIMFTWTELADGPVERTVTIYERALAQLQREAGAKQGFVLR